MNIWNTVYNVNKLYLHPGSGWTNMFIHNNGTWRVGFSRQIYTAASTMNKLSIAGVVCTSGDLLAYGLLIIMESCQICSGKDGKNGKKLEMEVTAITLYATYYIAQIIHLSQYD